MTKIPSDDWDAQERDALAGLEPELSALAARHADDPPIELLRAAREDVLPEELQSSSNGHLAGSRWSRALVEGLDDVEPALDAREMSRMLERVQREGRPSRRLASAWAWPALAAAAAVVFAIVWLRPGVRETGTTPQPQAQVAVATPPPALVYHLTLDKPEVKLSAAALTWRGPSGQNALLADLKPALDAFRADDYKNAVQLFAPLTVKYPASVEVWYYDGISKLFAGDAQGSVASLTKAASLADVMFASDVAWYRAVAEERAGRADAARSLLTDLCRGRGSLSNNACKALEGWK